MKHPSLLLALLLLLSFSGMGQQSTNDYRQIAVVWQSGKPSGKIEVLNGSLKRLKIGQGRGSISRANFQFNTSSGNRLIITIDSIQVKEGAGATIITVNTDQHPFSFFLRDVNKEHPIYIPEYGAVVLFADDVRTFDDVENAVKEKNLQSKLQQIENEPEESFEKASQRTRDQKSPTWLGISRDMRIFQINQSLEVSPRETDVISPRNSSGSLKVPGSDNQSLNYLFAIGRGQGVESNVKRRLEDGVLPVLTSQVMDGEIDYQSVSFVSLESKPLHAGSPIGTDYLVADSYSAGHMFTDGQQEMVDRRLEEFKKEQDEQTVWYHRTLATNTGAVPRYAWFKAPRPGRGWWDRVEYTFEPGFSEFSEDQVFAVTKLNGEPIPNEEMAVLIKPGETASFEFYIPHSPVSKDRAKQLMQQPFEKRYEEVKKFWNSKLEKSASIHVPEKRINEMLQAGLLHLDLITYGKEPKGTLAPLIGIYSPIGTESSPIMQFYMSMGLHEQAKRSLMYFLEKQHEDGMIQNFGGYMVETGAALWSMGEYIRYTHDIEWLREVKPKLIKSCDFLINWRNGSKKEELRNKGFGLIAGKVADPEDPFHQYMLNAYGYLGLSRVAEVLQFIDMKESERLREEAKAWKEDILDSFLYSMAHSPVVPLGDGRWCPTVPPWTEADGPRALYIEDETFFSHGTFTVADVLLGPLYLIFCEVLKPDDLPAKMMLDYHSELFYQHNSVFSQPYYSRHNWVQIKRGMVKPYLKTYYNTFSAHADRETYSFWEHLYHASPHKTREEAWFLMETRWMLYLEDEETLRLLSAIPRRWMQDGEKIRLDNVSSYFGPVSLDVTSNLGQGYIEAKIVCDTDRKPGKVVIRLPHPDGQKPKRITGGSYDEKDKSVTISSFNGSSIVRLEF